jgi:predicted permease
MPYTFDGLMARGTAAWLPAALRPRLMAGSSPIGQDFSRATQTLYGKLKPGVSLKAGEAELTSITRELARRQPRAFRDDELVLGHLVQASILRGIQQSPAIAVFIVMVLLVLLSACANLGNMLLARGLVRQREILIRIAIGASRTRVVRQLMTENLLLAALGSLAAVAFGAISVRLLLFALGAPAGFRAPMKWPILVAGFLLAFLSAAAFGLPSALQTVHPNPRKIRLRQGLVGVQVAVSCLLLIAAGVLAHTGILSASTHLAFDYRNMVVIYPQIYGRNLTSAAAQQKLDALATRLGALPGVDGVTVAADPPLGGRLVIESLPGLPHVVRNSVAASYFTVMNLPIVRGRTFLPGEPGAVIVSESAARAVWPNQDPVGKLWNLAGAPRTVVGVAGDSGANLLSDADSVEAYLPVQSSAGDRIALILHTRIDPAAVLRTIPGAARAVNETVSVALMRTSRDNSLLAQRRMVTLIGSIGAVATTLAAAGMFALIAFAVAQRKRELGIRIAIGATSSHILRVLLSQNARAAAVGAVAGTVLAAILSRLVRSLVVLRNGGAVDVIGFAAGLACFALIAALATLSPALRALRIDPVATLREE